MGLLRLFNFGTAFGKLLVCLGVSTLESVVFVLQYTIRRFQIDHFPLQYSLLCCTLVLPQLVRDIVDGDGVVLVSEADGHLK